MSCPCPNPLLSHQCSIPWSLVRIHLSSFLFAFFLLPPSSLLAVAPCPILYSTSSGCPLGDDRAMEYGVVAWTVLARTYKCTQEHTQTSTHKHLHFATHSGDSFDLNDAAMELDFSPEQLAEGNWGTSDYSADLLASSDTAGAARAAAVKVCRRNPWGRGYGLDWGLD